MFNSSDISNVQRSGLTTTQNHVLDCRKGGVTLQNTMFKIRFLAIFGLDFRTLEIIQRTSRLCAENFDR